MGVIWAHFGYHKKGKEFYESPVSRYYLGSDPSEGAPRACLSNRAFDVNIRKAREMCKHRQSLSLGIDADNPRLLDIRVIESRAGLHG